MARQHARFPWWFGAVVAAVALQGRPATAQPAAPPAPDDAAGKPEASAEPPAPALAAPPPTCPGCAPGLFCQGGACVPVPHPVCAPGFFFDGYYCVPAAWLAQPPAVEAPDPEEERAKVARLRHHLRPKLTIDIQGAMGLLAVEEWDDSAVLAATGVLWLGYRQNFQPRFGLHVRGGLMLGFVEYSVSESTSTASSETYADHASLTGGLLEVVPFFGPFGRFYVGPMAWLGYAAFGDHLLEAGSNRRFSLQDGAMYGIGGSGGILVGQRYRTDLNFSIRIDLNSEHKTTFLGMFGVGFHL